MPELPEVETVVRGLQARIVGQRLHSVVARRGDMLECLGTDPGRGWQVTAVRRRGKMILVDLTRSEVLSVHLGMSGQLSVEPRSRPLADHTHVVGELEGGIELRYVDPRRFGRVQLARRPLLEAGVRWRALGPEPLGLGAVALERILAARTTAIKAALLDQHAVAGLGNIYVDEILHASGIHPSLEANRLRPAEIDALVENIQRILLDAIAAGGSTIRDYRNAEGGSGSFQSRHRVYGRAGQGCLRCGETLRKILVAGRGTHFCPRCQPRRRRRPRPRRRSSKRAT